MTLSRHTISNGSIELLKWLGLLLMTGDHVNKYLFNGSIPLLFNAGRLALPLFAFVLGYNLARPATLTRGGYGRAMKRLVCFGLAATPAFIALGGLIGGWWPLNIMFTLLAATVMLYLIARGGIFNWVGAVTAFLVGGGVVEFGWPALAICLAGWYWRPAPVPALLLLLVACFTLWPVNGNPWALVALPLIMIAPFIQIPFPRWRRAFYFYYPLHLGGLWLIRIPMRKAGYLFFS